MTADMRIVEALAGHKPEWRGSPEEHAVLWCCTCDEYRTREYDEFLAHLAAVIELIVRAREVSALRDAADSWTQGAWADTPRHADRLVDRMAASQFAGDWLRERADRIEAGNE